MTFTNTPTSGKEFKFPATGQFPAAWPAESQGQPDGCKGGGFMTRYPAVIDGERGAYGVVIPDMPGACCAMGATVDEALSNAEAALTDFVDLLNEKGETIPPPSAVENVELEPGEMVAFVTLKTPIQQA